MNGIRNQKKELRKIRNSLTDEELFLSKAYQNSLWKFARVLGGKPSVRLMLAYVEGMKEHFAFTDGDLIFLNTINPVTEQFPSREGKMVSHEGLVAHECGHLRFSDFDRRGIYVGGFGKGKIYPKPPTGTTEAEQKVIEEIKSMVRQHDRAAVAIITRTASYLNNVLEDVYIESQMCQRYPGSVRTSIQKNAAAMLAQIPSAEERKAGTNSGLNTMLDMIFRYARSGESPAERDYERKYQILLEKCKDMIDEAVESDDLDIRFYTANDLLVKLWRYIKLAIRDAKKELGRNFSRLSEEQQKQKLKDYLGQHMPLISLSDESQRNGQPKNIDGWDGKLDGTEETNEPESVQEGEQNESGQKPEHKRKNQAVQVFREEAQNRESGTGQAGTAPLTGASAQGAGNEEALKKVGKLLNQAAEEAYARQVEEALKRLLQEETEQLPLDGIHRDVPVEIFRKSEPLPQAEVQYREMLPEIRCVSHHLQKAVEPLLIQKEGGTLSGLYMGKRLSKGSLYRNDGRIFEKRILPEDGFSVAFAVLVDNSGSMCINGRIEAAKKTALILYDFCRALEVPITVYGHTTCDVIQNGKTKEGVALYSFAEFDSVDGKDPLRIAEMEDRNCNRDGLALRFVGEHLAKREEDIKILILISDGSPYADGYSGITAVEDLKQAKRELQRKGIQLFAAAIGDDRESIEAIYGDSFLNISDLRTMPQKMAGLLMKYLR